MTESHPATVPGSRRLQVLGIALVLVGIGIIFAGEFEVLPRGGLSSAIGGGVVALGVLVHLRGRVAQA